MIKLYWFNALMLVVNFLYLGYYIVYTNNIGWAEVHTILGLGNLFLMILAVKLNDE